MPLELGMLIGLGRNGHTFVLIDEKFDDKGLMKFDVQISNLKGAVEPIRYNSNPVTLIEQLLMRMQGGGCPEARIKPGVMRQDLVPEIQRIAGGMEQALNAGNIDEVVEAYIRMSRPDN